MIGSGGEVGAVVALKPFELAVFEAEQSIHGAIEEVAVVGDHHHAAAEILEEVLEHAQGVHVEVVGGLIEQQHIGGFDQQPAEVEPPPLAAGELANGLVLLGRRKQKALEQLGGTDLHPIHRHPAGRIGHHIDHLAFRFEQHVAVLVEVGELHGGSQLQAAATGRPPAGDHLQQAGFAGAIGANDADAIFWAEVVTELAQQRLLLLALTHLHPELLGRDGPLAQAPTGGGEAHLALGLPHRRFPHRLDALNSGFLLGASGLRPPLEPGQLPPQGALEFGGAGGG